jgi:YfiH family protein
MSHGWISPDWAAPPRVRAFSTTRSGGCSSAPWDGLNLGAHCGDDPAAVHRNRALLRAWLPAEPTWLAQVHGVTVHVHPDDPADALPIAPGAALATSIGQPVADAQVASLPGQVCVVLTADCLPVLFCNRSGSRVAAAHAGWRGMLAGVLEHTVRALRDQPEQLLAWLGPAIGAAAYEVGEEVRQAFLCADPAAAACFRRHQHRWLFDLYAMARQRLAKAGVVDVWGGGRCTFSEPEHFFSYRRDGRTGRMASVIWLEP